MENIRTLNTVHIHTGTTEPLRVEALKIIAEIHRNTQRIFKRSVPTLKCVVKLSSLVSSQYFFSSFNISLAEYASPGVDGNLSELSERILPATEKT